MDYIKVLESKIEAYKNIMKAAELSDKLISDPFAIEAKIKDVVEEIAPIKDVVEEIAPIKEAPQPVKIKVEKASKK